ncbi:MAG: response regulator [Chloroflexi bacterium]|nr:response regulator [Chloroflexota bacterium]
MDKSDCPRELPPLPGMEAGEWVRITVSDTGTGIPPDVVPQIFNPFFTTKAPGEGTGLGLAQVYGIAKAHDGYIGVDSRVGQGTTFTLCLPALAVHKPELPIQRTEYLIQGQGQTILVVEDNGTTRKAITSILKTLNYQVLEAANGQEALVVLEQSLLSRSPHEGGKKKSEVVLVVSDVVMPEMGGQALFHTLKDQYPAVKVILLTGHPMEQELEGLRPQGLVGWMLKPPKMENLARMMAQALAEAQLRDVHYG